MTRFLYSDPLAAAYMAKHFKINLQIRHSYAGTDFGLLDVTALQVDALGMIVYVEATKGGTDFAFGDRAGEDEFFDRPFFVHPDSLSILLPAAGDLIRAVDANCDHIVFRIFNAGEDTGIWQEAWFRIIQRSGKPFFWPEQEEV